LESKFLNETLKYDSDLKQYLSLRIKESIVLFLGTLFFTKLMFLAMFGMSNVSGGGAMAAAGGVLFLVI
jgi:hypothetical protein